ncbi:cathepsin L-like proteinase [Oppia nitens]|uniref:cathepsin L-like proteinase n=1 Tax=Oppia nitens TaxID=1686743 RepID=UPI0023DB5F5A|nr:cathepsin L-like proteinase [Oppia nitens]
MDDFNDVDKQWLLFKQNFRSKNDPLTNDRLYKNLNEEQYRRSVFEDNYRRIVKHNQLFNQGIEKNRQSVNMFSDWTDKEFYDYNKPLPIPINQQTI